jgi:hypothetical protein
MSAIPLHLERRFEQRWASRFARVVTLNAPMAAGKKAAPSTLADRRALGQRPKEKPAGRALPIGELPE